jgi:hypothetical protein
MLVKQPAKVVKNGDCHLKSPKNLKTCCLSEITDKYVGNAGTERRDAFESRLRNETAQIRKLHKLMDH